MNQFDKLSRIYRTPKQVQIFLRSLKYNHEEKGETLRSASQALKLGSAHCLEACFIAAAMLEKHGYPPLVLSFESKDQLDHVIFIFQENGKWGSIARSRDDGLHGRPPVFRSLRDLAFSYFDPYIDKTGRIKGFQIANLDDTKTDWRMSTKNIWKAEQYLIDLPHRKLPSSDARYKKMYGRYLKRGPMKSLKWWW